MMDKSFIKILFFVFLFFFPVIGFSQEDFLITKNTFNHFTNLDSQKESVICIHAFLRSYTSLKTIGKVFDREGYEIFLWNYETRKFTLEEHADHLVKLMKTIAKQKPGQPIHFVTHSIGGVIARVALSHPECPKEAKKGRAVLLAPPNTGSTLARKYLDNPIIKFVFGDKLGKQLMTYTEKEMLNVGKFPKSVNVMILAGNKKTRFIPYALTTENDGKVCLKETSLNTPYKRHIINVSHTYIVSHKKSLQLTKEFITQTENKDYSQNKTPKRSIHIIHCFASHPFRNRQSN